MNYMPEVAHLLGLELEEEFRFKSKLLSLSVYKFKFTEDYLMYYHTEENHWSWASFATLCNLLNGEYEVVRMTENVLTEQERQYLSLVVKPFRDEIQSISKKEGTIWEWIYIKTKKDNSTLPCFEKGKFYKGMETGKDYSLEELGL